MDAPGLDEIQQQQLAFVRDAATAAEQHTKEWIRAALREVVCCVLQSCIQQQSELDLTACQAACDVVVQAWKEQYRAGLTDASQYSVVMEWMDQVLEKGRDSLYMENPPPQEPDYSAATAHGSCSSLPTVQQWTQLRDIATPIAKDIASVDYSEVHAVLDDSIARHHASPAWCRSFVAQIPGRLHTGTKQHHNADNPTEPHLVLRRKRKRSQAQLASTTRNATLKSTVPRPPSPPPRRPDDDVPLTLTTTDIVTTTRRFLPPDDDNGEPVTSARMMASLGRLGSTPRHRQWRLFPKQQLQKHEQFSHRVVRTIHPGTGQYWMDCSANGYVMISSAAMTQQQQVYMFRSVQISLLDEDTPPDGHDDDNVNTGDDENSPA